MLENARRYWLPIYHTTYFTLRYSYFRLQNSEIHQELEFLIFDFDFIFELMA